MTAGAEREVPEGCRRGKARRMRAKAGGPGRLTSHDARSRSQSPVPAKVRPRNKLRDLFLSKLGRCVPFQPEVDSIIKSIFCNKLRFVRT